MLSLPLIAGAGVKRKRKEAGQPAQGEGFEYYPSFLGEKQAEKLFKELKKLTFQKSSGGRKRAQVRSSPSLKLNKAGEINTNQYYKFMDLPELRKAKEAVDEYMEEHYKVGTPTNFALLNYYKEGKSGNKEGKSGNEEGQSGIMYHSDDMENSDKYIVSLSVGATRKFLIRNREMYHKYNKGKDAVKTKYLGNGDLFLWDEEFNAKNEHSIPKAKGERINITFRYVLEPGVQRTDKKPLGADRLNIFPFETENLKPHEITEKAKKTIEEYGLKTISESKVDEEENNRPVWWMYNIVSLMHYCEAKDRKDYQKSLSSGSFYFVETDNIKVSPLLGLTATGSVSELPQAVHWVACQWLKEGQKRVTFPLVAGILEYNFYKKVGYKILDEKVVDKEEKKGTAKWVTSKKRINLTKEHLKRGFYFEDKIDPELIGTVRAGEKFVNSKKKGKTKQGKEISVYKKVYLENGGYVYLDAKPKFYYDEHHYKMDSGTASIGTRAKVQRRKGEGSTKKGKAKGQAQGTPKGKAQAQKAPKPFIEKRVNNKKVESFELVQRKRWAAPLDPYSLYAKASYTIEEVWTYDLDMRKYVRSGDEAVNYKRRRDYPYTCKGIRAFGTIDSLFRDSPPLEWWPKIEEKYLSKPLPVLCFQQQTKNRYLDWIMDGSKTLETRPYIEEGLLGSYVGLIVGYKGNASEECPSGRKIMPAIVKIGPAPVLYGSKEAFDGDFAKHRVRAI